jgi:hypothetical protein
VGLESLARAKSVTNPFVSNRVDSAWDPDPVDVEAINRTAFDRCTETIRLVRETGQCRGLLLSGEPGAGKTHLLQRLRRHCQREGQDCFVYVPPVSGPDRFFRDLLQHTVRDFVSSRPGSPTSQLESLLVRELLRPETRARVSAELLWADVRRRHASGEALFQWLERPMALLCERLEIDPETARVLRHYLAGHGRADAYAWLLGRSVPEASLARLGVGRTLEEDPDAFQALVTLARIAGRHAVLILAFDQLEGLQVHPDDREGLLAFATGVARLFVECRNVAAVSCVQTYFRQDMERTVPPAHMQRLAQDQGSLTPLDRSAAFQLVAGRLAAVTDLADARQALGVADPVWPLQRRDVEGAVTAGGVPARQLLNLCRDWFEIWRRGEAVPATPALPADPLQEAWDGRTAEAASAPPDEGVLADGLLRLIDARSAGRARRGRERDIDLVVAGTGGEVGVAVCHAQNMTSLATRLKRLQKIGASGRYRRLVVVRDERLPISPTARATRERLAALEAAGHAVVRPSAEAYAAIAAARELLAEAAAGDLSANGEAVAPEDLKTWLAGHLDSATTAVLDALDPVEAAGEGAGAPGDDTLTRLQELLDGVWVVRADAVAPELGLEESALVAALTTPQRLIGLLRGPPAVLFLRPEGLQRE